jgi:glycosyltransferase involved in cell wall biosynthesis
MTEAFNQSFLNSFSSVLPKPTAFVLSLTRAIAATSTRIIVLSPIGLQLLVDVYGIEETKISVVRHGVPDVPFADSLSSRKSKLGFFPERLIMTTFGLLHRDKNIELVLKAMQTAVRNVPQLLYLIIGQTHPAIQLQEGEAYLNGLKNNVTAFGLTDNVRFINSFLGDDELISYLTASDIYITPYIHEEQYVSGTLSWAVGLGLAVISTPYLYAKELLADGRGFLFPFADHRALASIIMTLANNPQVLNSTRHQAYQYGRRMVWSNVARENKDIFHDLLI